MKQSLWALAAAGWRLYMGSRGAFLLPVLLLEVPLLLVNVGVLAWLDPGPTAITASWIVGFTVFTLADSILTLTEAVFAFLLLALIAVQVRALRAGQPLALGAAFRQVLPRLWALLGGSFLLVVSVGLLTAVGVFFSVVFSLVLAVLGSEGKSLAEALRDSLVNPTQNLWLQLLLLALIATLSIFLVVKWSLMVQVVVLEDSPPVHALQRSWQLIRGAFWRTLGTLLISSLPISLLSNGTLVAQFLGVLPEGGNRVAVLAVVRGIALFLRLLVLPWVLILLTLYYYDLRVRRESAAPRAAG
ncbi:MAG TPA: hypothetical protein VKY74_14290 [Chloroflexia bacterium]|nr:hypothetical protein [Chloroflexia bacterium]